LETLMAETLSCTEYPPLVLRTRPAIEMSDREFFEFCQINGDWRIERTARGDVEIMPPAGGETSNRNAIITAQLTTWALRDGTGAAFDSSGGFILPNGATRAPDAAWVRRERLRALSAEERQRFLPLCPDFAIELRSPTDRLAAVRAKMEEYLANGARLGWLIDAPGRRVDLYRPGAAVERLEAPPMLSGESVLPGFVLDLRPVWDVRF
jgi:Uma2 family endonuclease